MFKSLFSPKKTHGIRFGRDPRSELVEVEYRPSVDDGSNSNQRHLRFYDILGFIEKNVNILWTYCREKAALEKIFIVGIENEGRTIGTVLPELDPRFEYLCTINSKEDIKKIETSLETKTDSRGSFENAAFLIIDDVIICNDPRSIVLDIETYLNKNYAWKGRHKLAYLPTVFLVSLYGMGPSGTSMPLRQNQISVVNLFPEQTLQGYVDIVMQWKKYLELKPTGSDVKVTVLGLGGGGTFFSEDLFQKLPDLVPSELSKLLTQDLEIYRLNDKEAGELYQFYVDGKVLDSNGLFEMTKNRDLVIVLDDISVTGRTLFSVYDMLIEVQNRFVDNYFHEETSLEGDDLKEWLHLKRSWEFLDRKRQITFDFEKRLKRLMMVEHGSSCFFPSFSVSTFANLSFCFSNEKKHVVYPYSPYVVRNWLQGDFEHFKSRYDEFADVVVKEVLRESKGNLKKADLVFKLSRDFERTPISRLIQLVDENHAEEKKVRLILESSV